MKRRIVLYVLILIAVIAIHSAQQYLGNKSDHKIDLDISALSTNDKDTLQVSKETATETTIETLLDDTHEAQTYRAERLILKHDILQHVSKKHNIPTRLLEASIKTSATKKELLKPDEARELLATLYNIRTAKDVPILAYHHLLKESENRKYRNNNIAISLEMFQQHMDLLHEHGYTTLTMDELALYLGGYIQIPEKSVVITFDDGYLSNFVYAYPILKEYGFKATIFTITGMVRDEKAEFHPDYLHFFSWEEIDNHRDVFEFAGHTHDLHYISGKVSFLKARSMNKVKKDLKKSRELLETEYFAYPYGQYNGKIIDALQYTGYTMAFTTNPYRAAPGTDLFKVSRLCITSKTKLSYFKEFVGID